MSGLINPRIEYWPRGACQDVIASDVPEVLISGPAGTGKSRACLEKMDYCVRNYPEMRGLILRKVRSDLSESGLVTFERDVLGLDHPMVVDGPRRNYRQSYHYDNGSEIVVGGLDKPGKTLSAEYDLIYVQQAEQTQEEDWELLTRCLRNGKMSFQQLMGDANPAWPTHWLKRRCDDDRTVMLESRHEDNPLLWDVEAGCWTKEGLRYIATLDRLTGVRKQRLRHGLWVQAEGMVYDGWDEAVHLIDPFPIPEDWWRFRVVDFGYVNPFVCQWWAVDHDDRMYRYRELYHTRRLVSEHAGRIKELSDRERFRATVCDHDAEDRATLAANGVSTTNADKRVSVGIQAVQERMQIAGDDRARIFLFRGALVDRDVALDAANRPTCTEQEIASYVWSDKEAKDEPVKINDHGMDAMRYAVMYVDHGGLSMVGLPQDENTGTKWGMGELEEPLWRLPS